MFSPCSKSERRLFRDIENASLRRQTLLEDGKLSLASGAGKLVIIVSSAPAFGAAHLDPREQHRAFLQEAHSLKEIKTSQHQEAVVRAKPAITDMKFDFADPEVTDITLIGHGCISSLWADGGKNFDWRSASKATAYLKQGKIEQRMCGNLPADKVKLDSGDFVEKLPHRYSVPLGTFAVSKLSNVIAAPGIILPDVRPDERSFQPVFVSEYSPTEQIAAFNERFANVPSVLV